jgi:hypothetical protein
VIRVVRENAHGAADMVGFGYSRVLN